MASSYPGALDSFSTKVDNVDDVMAVDVNGLQDAVVALQTELGTDPAGSATDLKTRLVRTISNAGDLALTNVSTLTIASGSVTPVNNRHVIDTESAASSDNLDTINATTAGLLLALRIADDTRNVVIRHNIGNIYCPSGANITLDTTNQIALLIYDSGLSKWIAVGQPNAGLLAGDNTWSGVNTFSAAENHKLTSVSVDTTLDGTHNIVRVDASGAQRTITLPAAGGCPGRVYTIKRTSSGANTVVVDGNGSETIDGAATYTLTAQYQSLSIVSNGTSWDIV